LTVSVSEEKMIISAAIAPTIEKIAERKTIVYETRIDPAVIKVAAEKVKDRLFTRFGFLKPKPDEVEFVSMGKHYEPYMMISGKYCIDYYRKCSYAVKIDKEVLQVILLGHELRPEQATGSAAKYQNVIKLDGEERLVNEAKASLILNRSGHDVTLEQLPSAPSEKNPKRILAECGVEEVQENTDLGVIRSRILKRPKDINRVVSELFEVNERVLIYTPRFTVYYRNNKTGNEKAAEFDGVTAERIRKGRQNASHGNLPIPPPPPL